MKLRGLLYIILIGCGSKASVISRPASENSKASTEREIVEFIDRLKNDNPQAEYVESQSGLRYFILKKGEGQKAGHGREIKVHYTGTFLDGKQFDSSRDSGQPLTFKVGLGKVIQGWDEALLDMRIGEQRILIIPAPLAYGEKGLGEVIPPMTTLVFDVEMMEFIGPTSILKKNVFNGAKNVPRQDSF